MTVIEIRPHRWGWKAFETSGVEPVFPNKDQAIDYAQNRACFRSGEVRIFDSTGNVESVIPFDDANRKMWFRDRDRRAHGKTKSRHAEAWRLICQSLLFGGQTVNVNVRGIGTENNLL
jgi:hypothetical protein